MIDIGPIVEIQLGNETKQYRKYGTYPLKNTSTKRYIKSIMKHFSEFYPGSIIYKSDTEHIIYIPRDYESKQYKDMLKSIARCSAERCPICQGMFIDAPMYMYKYMLNQLEKEKKNFNQISIPKYDNKTMIGRYPEQIMYKEFVYKLSNDGEFYLCT